MSREEIKKFDRLLVGGKTMMMGWWDGSIAIVLDVHPGGGQIHRLNADQALQARRDYLLTQVEITREHGHG